MECPHCSENQLTQMIAREGVVVDVCDFCDGIWLDEGEILFFSNDREALAAACDGALIDPEKSNRRCPRCTTALEEGGLMGREPRVDRCPGCRGIWIERHELAYLLGLASNGSSSGTLELRGLVDGEDDLVAGAREPDDDPAVPDVSDAPLRLPGSPYGSFATWFPFLSTFLLVVAAALLGVVSGTLRPWMGVFLGTVGAGWLGWVVIGHRNREFPRFAISGLLRKVEVSPFQPVGARVRGQVVHELAAVGSNGSGDGVKVGLQDSTGTILLDLEEPWRLWERRFGALRPDRLADGDMVEATGWYRFDGAPYFEVRSIETTDGRCLRSHANPLRLVAAATLILGAALFLVI